MARFENLDQLMDNLRGLRRAFPAVAARAESESANLVAKAARGRVPIGPAAGGHAISSVKADGSQVTGGGPRFPYFGWLDFGGNVGKNNSVHRPFMKTGRIIWFSYSVNRGQVENQMTDAVVSAARFSGLEVRR